MNKFLRFSLLSLLVMLCSGVFAEKVTIDFDNDYAALFPGLAGTSSGTDHSGDFTEATTSTPVGGVTVTVSAKTDSSTDNRIWGSSPRLRMYSGTFTVTGQNITKIEFTGHSTNFNLSAATGTLDGKTWTGQADEVKFDVSKNTQISKIVVTLGNDDDVPGEQPEPLVTEGKGTVDDPYTVDDALKVIASLNSATSANVYAKGVVTALTDISTQYKNATFDISDDASGTNKLTVFRAKDLQNKDVLSDDILKIGDNVVIYGQLVNYNGVTPEFTQGCYIYSINGQTERESQPVTIKEVASIKDFAALAQNEVAKLTLTNAQVVYVNKNGSNTELFVRDATGAVVLYNTGLEAEAGQVLSGTLTGVRTVRSGFTVALGKTDDTDLSTVTVGAKQAVEPTELAIDEATTSFVCDLIKISDVEVSGGKAVADGVELALYDRFQLGLVSALKTDGTKYNLTGIIYDGGEQYGTELVVTATELANGGDVVEDPATPIANIGELLALTENKANLELTLTNAQVVFNDNNYIYVRDATGAVCFYQMTAELKSLMATNAILNGKIQVDYELYRLLPEVKTNAHTAENTLTAAEGSEAVPVETTLAEVAQGKNVADLVTLKAKKLKETSESGSNTYYLYDGDTKVVVVNNSKGLDKVDDNAEVIVTAVVNTNNNAYQLKLTKTVEVVPVEVDVEAPVITGVESFEDETEVTITAQEGATIWYTTDGSDPTDAAASGRVQAASPATFKLTATTTVKAAAEKSGQYSTVAEKTFTKVEYAEETIATLNELTANKQNVSLKLTDAQVVYVDGKNIYVREGDKAIMFYGTELQLAANTLLNGTVKVDYVNYNGIHEVKDKAGVTSTDGLTTAEGTEAQPTEATVEDILAMKHVSDYVVLKGVELVLDGNSVYAQQGDQKVQLYKGIESDAKALAANANGKKYDVEALFNNYYKSQQRPEVQPVKLTEVTGDGISSLTAGGADSTAPAYNLAGQRVQPTQKGLLIRNGKKLVVK